MVIKIKENKLNKKNIDKDYIISKMQEIIENDDLNILQLKQQEKIKEKINFLNNKIIELMKENRQLQLEKEKLEKEIMNLQQENSVLNEEMREKIKNVSDL